jgi:hypothetical protein
MIALFFFVCSITSKTRCALSNRSRCCCSSLLSLFAPLLGESRQALIFWLDAAQFRLRLVKSLFGFLGLGHFDLVDSFERTHEGSFSFIEFQFTREEVFHIKQGIDLPVTPD